MHTIHARIAHPGQYSERNNPQFWEFIKTVG
jgi:hypothetical protein